MEIEHFSHFHTLKLSEKNVAEEVWCLACEKRCWGPTYGCNDCEFFIHKSCAELPRTILKPFHPHSLTLRTAEYFHSQVIECCACRKTCPGFFYCCDICHYHLHIECTVLLPAIESEGHKQIQHFSHLHSLVLSEKTDDERLNCFACAKCCSGPTYGCSPCNFFLHKSCAELPEELQHHSHPFHPLTLFNGNLLYPIRLRCHACRKTCLGFMYRCDECDFNLDVRCAFSVPRKESDGHQEFFQHCLHKHPLALSDKNGDHEFYCFACEKRCSGPTFGCGLCQFFLHRSCAEVAQEIQHQSHQSHPLILFSGDPGEFRFCRACLKDCCNFCYRCDKCNFILDVECASVKPTIRYKGHNHLLTLVDNIYGGVSPCDACNETICESSTLFRCVECDFNLHLLCGPLPCVVKHKCHIDPLTLMDYLVEGDTDWFFCDACEEARDPRICVYYCADCTFVAHVSCVFSEVLLSLKGERGNVGLRTVSSQIVGKVISEGPMEDMTEQDSNTGQEQKEIELPHQFYELWYSFTKDELKELYSIPVVSQMGMLLTERTLFEGQNEDSISKIPPFSDKAFTELMERLERLDSKKLHPERLLDDEEFVMKLVKVKDYMVIKPFVPVLNNLLVKYGDISAESKLSARPKLLLVNILCAVVNRMRTTKVFDITEDLLVTWWRYLRIVHLAGFKIQVAIDHLNRVVRAYFGLQARKYEVELAQELKQLSEEMKKLTVKIEGKRKKHETYKKSANSNLMKQCLSDALALEWKTAAEGIIDVNLGPVGSYS